MTDYNGPERRAEIHVQCTKEMEWGQLQEHMKSIDESQKRMERKQEKVLEQIFGNGKEGLRTRAALNKQAISRAWWWLGGLSLAFIGLAFRSFVL